VEFCIESPPTPTICDWVPPSPTSASPTFPPLGPERVVDLLPPHRADSKPAGLTLCYRGRTHTSPWSRDSGSSPVQLLTSTRTGTGLSFPSVESFMKCFYVIPWATRFMGG